MTPAQKIEIVSLRRSGKKLKDIAAVMNLKLSAVAMCLSRLADYEGIKADAKKAKAKPIKAKRYAGNFNNLKAKVRQMKEVNEEP